MKSFYILFNHIIKEATENQLDYFDTVLGFPNKINSSNQIWQFKEFFTLMNMVVSLLMLIPLTKSILKFKFFRSLIKPVPDPLPRQSAKGKTVFGLFFYKCNYCMRFIYTYGGFSKNFIC